MERPPAATSTMTTMKRPIASFLLATIILAGPALARQPSGNEAVFLEAWRVTANAFYDPKMHGVDWDVVRTELQPRARAASTPAELSAVINEALSRLHASHTEHYTQDQREYYELLDIFFPDGVPAREGSKIEPGPVQYVGIGIATQTIDGRTFAADIYDTGPADKAGILPGDELLNVEGQPWGDVAPFRGRDGKPTRITIQRTPDPASRRELTATPELIRPHALFLASVRGSARIIKQDGKRIGYVRIRSYSHPDYHEALKEVLSAEFEGADGMVLDLRGGWGGANPSYMDIFNPTVPALTYRTRDGRERRIDPTWRRPVAMLIDGGTRSGKEVLACAFKKHAIGPLVGERSAGAVLAGTPRPLADGSVLYLAVSDVRVDGESLEGRGVEPDVTAARKLPYCEGKDEQIEAAVAAVMKQLGQKGKP